VSSADKVPGAPLALTVLSLGRGVAAAFATRNLADLGASCSWWRWGTPRPGDWPPDETFLSYFTEGIEVVEEPRALPAVLDAAGYLAGHYDVVLTDLGAAEQPAGELFSRLAAFNPALVVGVADHFGRTGPYSRWAGDELTDYAMGGYWGFGGHPEREPLRVPGYQAQLHAGLALSVAVLAAARHARRTGAGQEVEVTGVEAMLGAHWDATVTWTHTGKAVERAGPDLFRAADGFVFFYQVVWFPGLVKLIDRPDLAGDPRWSTWPAWQQNAAEFWAVVAEWCATRSMDEIVSAAQQLRLPVVAMADARTLLEDASLAARGFFRDIAGKRLPGRPVLWSTDWPEPAGLPRLAPLLAGPARPVRTAPNGLAQPPGRGGSGPLAGVRVLELSNNWAGPLAGRHLADLGAEVIKVEHPVKPWTRAGFYPGNVAGSRHWNRSGYFNEMNRNKRSVALNLADPRGRDLFLSLVRKADVVLQNNSARVMPKLGLGYDTLREVNPRIVMASISGFGATGPRRDWVAFGSNIEVATGLAATAGYDAQTPYRTGSFVADPIGGTQAALAIVAALELAERTGSGAHLDVSLVEATLPFMIFSFARLHSTGAAMVPSGNRDDWDAPTGAYPTDGPDQWIALAIRDDNQWAALAAVSGLDPALGSTRESRLASRELIDKQLRGWTATLPQHDAARILQRAGVPAAPILKNHQFHSDPHLFAREAFIPIEHPETGVLPYPGFPWRMPVTPPSVRSAAPCFAEGNDYVFGRLLGLGEDEIADLYATGISSLIPSGLDPVLSDAGHRGEPVTTTERKVLDGELPRHRRPAEQLEQVGSGGRTRHSQLHHPRQAGQRRPAGSHG
jgi:crotonobetainyl-CoA:carnitine CoA-transferase CaiB-like acyl-CoA transferase